MLLELFNELSGKGRIELTEHGRVRYLDIGGFEGVLRLGIDTKERSNTIFPYIHVHLRKLLKELGAETLVNLMRELSEIPGFQWVHDRMDVNKPWIWSRIKDIIVGENPDCGQAKERLAIWILELNEAIG